MSCSAYHKIVVLDLHGRTDPVNSSAVGNNGQEFEMGENMGCAVQQSVAQKFV